MAELLHGLAQAPHLPWLLAAGRRGFRPVVFDATHQHRRPLLVVKQRVDMIHQRRVVPEDLANVIQSLAYRRLPSARQRRNDGVGLFDRRLRLAMTDLRHRASAGGFVTGHPGCWHCEHKTAAFRQTT